MSIDLQMLVRSVADEIAADAAAIEADADAKHPDAVPGGFGIAVATADLLATGGDATTRFPLQSITKVFALERALATIGDDVFDRVGREPSGDPFNSIVDLERNAGVPRNPFINAGALIVADILTASRPDDRPAGAVVDLIAAALGGATIPFDDDVLRSEHDGGDLNRAMMSFCRHHGNLHAEIDAVMETYVRQCAISLDCAELARAGRYLADTARVPGDADADRAAQRRRRVLSLMVTCGHYDGSGDFAYRVGVAAKSGVGGGILAVVPGVAAIATWSPNLDQHGNSILGVHALEMLCDRADWSLFRPA